MSKQAINIGSAANDGTGDPLRTAFDKINDNFNEIYDTLGGPSASSLSDLYFQGSTITNRTTNGNITIDPNGTGTVFINGPIEFKGSATQIDTTSLQIEDNLLELNRNSSGADVDAGIFVNRGSGTDAAFFYWDEGDDKWKAGLAGSSDSSAVSLNSTATVVANIEGDTLQVNSISSGDSTAVQINDAVNISGALSVDTIDVNTISSEDSSAIQIQEDVNISGSLTVAGGSLSVNNISSPDSTALQINDGLDVNGTLTCARIESNDSSEMTFLPQIKVENSITVDGFAVINGSITYGVDDLTNNSTIELDLSTAIHYLKAGEAGYTLAAPVAANGLLIYFTVGHGSSADSTNNPVNETKVTVAKVRDTTGEIIENYEWLPFNAPIFESDSTKVARLMATAIFVDGAWNLDLFTS
jgi:hypothetical protein